MANDCVMVEGSRVGGGGEEERENGNGIELSLELSIGGSYAKSEKLMASGVKGDADLGDSGRSSGGSGECGVFVDPQARREIQALRRQEARKKREGKLKRVNWKEMNGYGSGSGSGSGNGGLNSDQDDSRVRVRDNGNVLTEPASKRERRNGDGIVGENQGSIPVVPAQFTNGLVNFYGGMTCLGAIGENEMKSEKCGFQPAVCRSFRPYQGNRNSEWNCGKEARPVNASVSPGRNPSAFSGYPNSILLGGNSSDKGSNSSSYSQAKVQQPNNVSSPSDPPEQSQHSSSSKQTESNQAVYSSADSPTKTAVKPSEMTKSDAEYSPMVNNNALTQPRPQTEKTPDPTTLRPQMPCVSTTGNGPNGKTVMGFLYRYNKDEVSIVCVCHGSSFSPAEFVEHAGGIDITHPLRHITVIPPALG